MKDILNDAQNFSSSIRTKKEVTGPGAIKVDPNFIEDRTVSKVVEFAIKRRKNCFIWGHTGCGKSSLVINIAARLQEQMEVFNCDGETSTDNLIAKPWRQTNGELVCIHGAAVRAYEQGKILLLEEVDHAQPDILAAIHRIMEPNQDFITLNIGREEIISKHPQFTVIATANTNGSLDMSHLYPGVKQLNGAFLNRFALFPHMDFISPETEKKVLINKTGIAAGQAKILVDIAKEARTGLEQEEINMVLSTRDLLNWSEGIMGLGMSPLEVAEVSFLSRADENDKSVLKELINQRCP